jgi:hypothetical protein
MKKIFAILSIVCCLTLTQNYFGQTNPNPQITINRMDVDDDSYFKSAQIEQTDKSEEVQFVGQVSFLSKNFLFWGAEKAIFNKATKKITVYGKPYMMGFFGKTIKRVGKTPSIEYTIGDCYIYVTVPYVTVPPLKTDVKDDSYFESSQIEYDPKTGQTHHFGNVLFKSKRFEFSGAELVIFNNSTEKMTVFNPKGFTVDGKVIVGSGKKLSNIIEYTIGEDVVYVF